MMKEYLQAALKTLNCVEVKGRDNLDKLLACIMAIESILQELEGGTPSDIHYDEQRKEA